MRSLKAMARVSVALWASIFISGVALAEPAPAGKAPADGKGKKKKAPKVTETPEFQMAMWRQINGTGPQIDRCTSKYLATNAGAKGAVNITFSLSADGRVARRRLTTGLRGQDRIISCLTAVTRQWRFPPIGTSKVDSSVTVPVAAGVKFKMLKPGEKPPARKARAKKKPKKDGFIRFAPGLPGVEPQVNVN